MEPFIDLFIAMPKMYAAKPLKKFVQITVRLSTYVTNWVFEFFTEIYEWKKNWRPLCIVVFKVAVAPVWVWITIIWLESA